MGSFDRFYARVLSRSSALSPWVTSSYLALLPSLQLFALRRNSTGLRALVMVIARDTVYLRFTVIDLSKSCADFARRSAWAAARCPYLLYTL